MATLGKPTATASSRLREAVPSVDALGMGTGPMYLNPVK
jgi:hypothetical protein